jgi:hypothetical protein
LKEKKVMVSLSRLSLVGAGTDGPRAAIRLELVVLGGVR